MRLKNSLSLWWRLRAEKGKVSQTSGNEADWLSPWQEIISLRPLQWCPSPSALTLITTSTASHLTASLSSTSCCHWTSRSTVEWYNFVGSNPLISHDPPLEALPPLNLVNQSTTPQLKKMLGFVKNSHGAPMKSSDYFCQGAALPTVFSSQGGGLSEKHARIRGKSQFF